MEEWNIILVTPDEHARKGRGFPGEEKPTDKLYKDFILKAKQRYEEQTHN